ncbi:hypothetical protein [Cellulomonas telluris]|uniref:hypothetical protein n=1 Tax=Cellulomonas telluris TaxID=2306636 RepID=UPI0010A82E71|nr:hypothetical protein [Cellulomonas telluris]
MDPTAGAALRTARALLVAATALASAGAAHLSAGGAVPAPAAVAALLAVTTVAVLPLGGPRTFRVRVLAPAGAVLQVALHHAFTLLHPASPVTTPTHHAAGAAVRAVVAPTGTTPPGHGDPAALGHGDLPMVVAHAAAALATALLLVATDRAARAAAGWLSRVVPLLAHAALPAWPAPRPLPAGSPLVAAHSGAALGSAARRRGPPVAVRPGP